MCVQVICQVLAAQKVPLGGLTLPPHGLSPALAPQQPGMARFPLSASDRAPAVGAGAPGVKPAPCPPRGRYLHSARCFPSHILCQRWVKPILHFFKMSLASFPEPEHLLVLQDGVQAENSVCKFHAGLAGLQTSRGRSKGFSSYWSKRPPSFPVKPKQFADHSGSACLYLSGDLFFQLEKKKKNHGRMNLSPQNSAWGCFVQSFLLSGSQEEAARSARSLA